MEEADQLLERGLVGVEFGEDAHPVAVALGEFLEAGGVLGRPTRMRRRSYWPFSRPVRIHHRTSSSFASIIA